MFFRRTSGPALPPGAISVTFDADNLGDTFSGGPLTGVLRYTYLPTVPLVPEPATWAMMLIGFAVLGFAFRRSRRKVSFA
jgi:hypothetical protein